MLRRKAGLSDKDRLRLAAWRANYPELLAVYDLKERFYEIFDGGDRQAARDEVAAWKAGMTKEQRRVFKPLLTALRNWDREIFAYFDTGLTNAYTEAMNGVLKGITAAGRGYSFEVLRAKVLFRDNHTKRVPFGTGLDMTGFLVMEDLGVPFSTIAMSVPDDHDSTSDFG